MRTGSRTTVKDLKASIKRCAESAQRTFPQDAGQRSRYFCAVLASELLSNEATLALALDDVAGLALKTAGNESAL